MAAAWMENSVTQEPQDEFSDVSEESFVDLLAKEATDARERAIKTTGMEDDLIQSVADLTRKIDTDKVIVNEFEVSDTEDIPVPPPALPEVVEPSSLPPSPKVAGKAQTESTADTREPAMLEKPDPIQPNDEFGASTDVDLRRDDLPMQVESGRKRQPRRVPVTRPGLRVVRSGKKKARRTADAGIPTSSENGLNQDKTEVDVFTSSHMPSFSFPEPAKSNLGNESAPELLWRLYSQQVTGTVIIQQGQDVKEVFLENGVVVGVRSNQTVDRLEEMLFFEGLIDREAYAEARVKGIDQSRALAAHLVERGILRPSELFPLVRRHLDFCLLGLFEWQEGQVHFESRYAMDAQKVRLAKPMASLIVEGIRRKFLLPQLSAKLGSPATLLAPIPSEDRSPLAPSIEDLGLLPNEQEVLKLVDGLRPIEEIVFLSGHEVATVYRVLLACVITGLLKSLVRGLRADANNPDHVSKREEEISRRRLEAKYDQVNKASYFEVLGVKKDATPYEIQTAFERLMREFHPVNFGHPSQQDLLGKLDIVQRSIEEAREVLSDELLRQGYQQSLENK